MLAFQGLAALCEKEDNSKLKSELFEVYPKLLQFHKGCVLLLVCSKFNEYVHINFINNLIENHYFEVLPL